MSSIRIMVIGDVDQVKPHAPEIEMEWDVQPFDIDELLEPITPAPDLIVWVKSESDTSDEEWAQHLRSLYLTQSIIGLLQEGDEDLTQSLVKNGFSNCADLSQSTDKLRKILFYEYLPKEELNDTLLVYSEDEARKPFIPEIFSEVVYQQLTEDTIMEPIDSVPAAVVVLQSQLGDILDIEAGQALRALYPYSTILFVVDVEKKIDMDKLRQNGFTKAFFDGIDDRLIAKELRDAAILVQGKMSYNPVAVMDLHADLTFTFDLYIFMPLRDKYLRYIKKGFPITQKQIDRLQGQSGRLYVPLHQMEDFYKYCAQYLKLINKEGTSKTEEREKLQSAVHDVFSQIFAPAKTFGEGDQAMEQLNGIVQEVLKGTEADKMKNAVSDLFAENGDLYESAANVSSLVAALSMGTGIGDPTELATAALLMDVGFVKLNPVLTQKPFDELSFEEQDEFKQHPDKSLEVINEKKMRISDNVRKYIREHQEYFNGKGYPRGLSGPKITSEVALLTLADIIVERMRDKKRMESPEGMIKNLRAEMKSDFDKMLVEPKFLVQVTALFLKKEAKNG